MAQTDDDDRAVAPTDPAEAGPAESGFESMADVRPGEPAGWKLARARVLGSLFGSDSTLGTFGRFRVLDRLGAGGMGVVYEAYDPTLARGVALKLVNVTAKDRETALAEAKALARLSHPNVVPIYDVGIESDHVYLVMELVRGQTLREWPEQRTLREILAVYRQAGVALAAAHGVGLVHRDFKPDNAIVGADGRVRVVDFGLACEADDPAQPSGEPRRIAGTPGFIAPEIKAGMAVTPAADQYSFAVALAEALQLAEASPPRHIAAAIERGRAADPAARFSSMAELVRVLERDPARTRRRIAATAGLAVSVGAIAFVVGQGVQSDPCDDGDAQLENTWSSADRAAALDRIATLGPHGLSVRPVLEGALVGHARRWVAGYRAACVDSRSGTESGALIDRRTTCLDRGRDALAAVRARIAQADPTNLAELPRAVQSMPDPEQCRDRDLLLSDIAPPPPEHAAQVIYVRRRIAQARIDVGAGRYEQALAEARAAVADARGIGYEPVLAEALLVEGHARMNLARRYEAASVLTEAMTLAVSSHDDALAVEAWARRVYARGTWADPGGVQAGLDVIEPVARRTQTSTFARALLYNNVGTAELAGSRRAQARAYFERALAESQRGGGPVALELISIRENLALVTDDHRRADELFAEAAGELATRLGADHPDALDARMSRGFVTIEDLHQADALLTPVCREYESWALAARAAECWPEVGLIRLDLGDRGGARQAMEANLQVQSDAAEAAAYVALLRGEPQVAARQFAEALAAQPAAPDDPWWVQLSRAQLALGLGRARRDAGDLPGACEALEAAVAGLGDVVRAHPQASYERRLGRAQVELAFTLSALRASPDARAAVAAPALAWLRRVGGPAEEIRRLESER